MDRVRAGVIASLICIAVLASLTVGKQNAAAASSPPATGQLFGVHPAEQGSTTLPGGHFNFALVPGESISDGVVVENFSHHALTLHIYGADLLTATGGGLAPAQPTAKMREVGAWIRVSAPILKVPASSQLTDNFRLTLPKVVSSGQHLGAVVAAAQIGVTPQGNPIEARVALIAVVTVPGIAHASASLTRLIESGSLPGQVGFGITLSNTGNVLLTYTGSVRINDGRGARVATVRLTPTNAYVVPSGHVQLAAIWNEVAASADSYRAQATVTILADGVPVRTLTSQSIALALASGVPVVLFGAVALGLMAMAMLAAWIIRRRDRPRERTARAVAGTRVCGPR